MTGVFVAFFLLTIFSFTLGRKRAYSLAEGRSSKLFSRPKYHGYYVAIWCAVPAISVLLVWLAIEPTLVRSMVLSSLSEKVRDMGAAEVNVLYARIRNLSTGAFGLSEPDPKVGAAVEQYLRLRVISWWSLVALFFASAIAGITFAKAKLSVQFKARELVETWIKYLLVLSSTIAILTTVGIIFSLLFETIRFFQMVSVDEFLFGLKWSPQIALRKDQVGSSGSFGAVPLFSGTALIAGIAMTVAAPAGLLSAIYLSEYASARVRAIAKPLLEILAGVPTVVYGFFAALTVAPFIRDIGVSIGLDVSSESALAAGSVMGIMIIPYVSSLSDDVINAVPQTLRDGSYALGATQSETIKRVVIPAALPGIVGALLLAVSRAIGETMIVVMAAGLAANLTANPLANVTTVTVQIVTALVGDQEFDSAKTLSVFALGLVLFIVTLILNVIALQVVKRYREKYD